MTKRNKVKFVEGFMTYTKIQTNTHAYIHIIHIAVLACDLTNHIAQRQRMLNARTTPRLTMGQPKGRKC